jgi:type III restriction enzyme
MATGSGKTLIMAGLILYLFEQGFSKYFYFSSNSTNIIEKTKDNFLIKVQLSIFLIRTLLLGIKRVHIQPVINFEG